jgi:hypothetical protein
LCFGLKPVKKANMAAIMLLSVILVTVVGASAQATDSTGSTIPMPQYSPAPIPIPKIEVSPPPIKSWQAKQDNNGRIIGGIIGVAIVGGVRLFRNRR